MKTYTNTLKQQRNKLGLSQQDIARKLDISVSNQDRISKWETGQAAPNIENLFKLCRMYNIHPFELYPEL